MNRYDNESGVFIKYYNDNNNNNDLTNNYVTDIDEDDSGFLWISTKCGIAAVNMSKLNEYTKDFNVENLSYIYNVDEDLSNDKWVLTKGEVFKYDRTKCETSLYKIDIGETVRSNIEYILCDSKENIWLASSQGLIKYNEEDNTTKIYKSERNVPNSLVSNTIKCLYEDRNGVLWIGTKSSGVINFIVDTKEIVRYLYYENNEKTLSSNAINEILEIDSGKIIVSTYSGIDTICKDTREVIRKSENDLTKKYVNEILKIFND